VPASAAAVAAVNIGANIAVAHGRSVVAGRAPTVPEIMTGLFNGHPMVNDAGRALMPKLAKSWGVAYNPRGVRVLPKDAKLEDESGQFTAFRPTTDVVLVFAVSDVEITEKPSVSGAFAAGFTAGFNSKDVSSQTTAALTAYKRDSGSGQHRRVWTGRCFVPIFSMDVSYPFSELVKSPEKAKNLWDGTTPKLVENCSKVSGSGRRRPHEIKQPQGAITKAKSPPSRAAGSSIPESPRALVEWRRIELPTFALRTRRSPS
jgi:hypothetical protein